MLDVTCAVTLGAPREAVAELVLNPLAHTLWNDSLEAVRLLTDGPLRVGSMLAQRARFVGQTFEHIFEVLTLEPLELRSVRGPFPLNVTYQVEDAQVAIHYHGDASDYFRLDTPLLTAMLRHNLTADLGRLRALLSS